jgi:dihydroneopterin aldolase
MNLNGLFAKLNSLIRSLPYAQASDAHLRTRKLDFRSCSRFLFRKNTGPCNKINQIFISGLKLETIIGIHAHEKLSPQQLSLDLTLTMDTTKAGKSDHLADTIDYDVLIKCIHTWVNTKKFQLIEALAHHLVDQLLMTFDIQQVELRLSKFPDGLSVDRTGIMITQQSD